MEQPVTIRGKWWPPDFSNYYDPHFPHSQEAFGQYLAVVNRLDLELALMQEAARAAFVEARLIEWDGWNSQWETETARGIAGRMLDSGDFSALPLLADAIQDAGCEDERLLGLMRRNRTLPDVGRWWLIRRLTAAR